MGEVDEILSNVKKGADKHYRLTLASTARVTRRKVQGYENVSPNDPEIKGTILEKTAAVDGTIRIGDQILQRTTKENRDRMQKQVDSKNQARLDLIKRRYLEGGEALKRQLGKQHAGLKLIHEEKDV